VTIRGFRGDLALRLYNPAVSRLARACTEARSCCARGSHDFLCQDFSLAIVIRLLARGRKRRAIPKYFPQHRIFLDCIFRQAFHSIFRRAIRVVHTIGYPLQSKMVALTLSSGLVSAASFSYES